MSGTVTELPRGGAAAGRQRLHRNGASLAAEIISAALQLRLGMVHGVLPADSAALLRLADRLDALTARAAELERLAAPLLRHHHRPPSRLRSAANDDSEEC